MLMRDVNVAERKTCAVKIGERVPPAVNLPPLAPPDVPGADQHSCFTVNRQVALVDPESREVVDIPGGRLVGVSVR